MSGKDQGRQGRSGATETRRLEKRLPQPPIFRVFFTDAASVIAAVFSVAFGVPLVCAALATQLTYPGFITYLLAGLAAVAAFVPLWQVRSIRRVFARGFQVPGLITGIGFHHGQGWVTFTYAYRGVRHDGYHAILQTRRARAMQPGDQVTIVLRPDRPEDAEIRELYL